MEKCKRKKWSDEEIQYMIDNYNTLSIKQFSEKFDRSPNAIRNKANELGLKQVDNAREKIWKDEEIEFLKNNYKKLSIKQIAKKLNRSNMSVAHKARLLGLQDKNEREYKIWTRKDDKYIERYYRSRGIEFVANGLNRSIDSVSKRVTDIGLGVFNGDGLTVNVLSECFSCDRKVILRWIDEYDLPHDKIIKGKSTYTFVYQDKFWNWAKKHKELIPWNKYERYSILLEPKWIENEIENNKYKNNNSKITWYDKQQILSGKKKGKSFREIAIELNRSEQSVEHIWRNLPKAQKELASR